MVIGNTRRVEEYDVAAGEVRLHVRDVGEAHAEPVLFLHGIMGHRRDWDVLVDRVGGPYRVLAVDQRGHGRSEWARSYGVSDMAADAIAVIEHLGVAPVSVVGHSMGAMVALVVAARRPELVDRIVLIDVVPESLTTDLGRQLPAMLEAMAASSYATVDDAVAEWQAGNPLARADLLRNYVTHALVPGPDGRFRWRFDASGLRSFSSGVSSQELWAAVDGVSCPGLVIRGEYSPVTTVEQVADVARRLGDAETFVIPDGGHDLGVEQPEAVADAVLDFLARTGRAGATR